MTNRAGELPGTAEVVIVGGGIAGAAIAFYLARGGTRGVVVMDAATVAHGASSRGPGILRTYYSDLGEAALAVHSLATFRNWESEVGGDCGYVPTGFLWIAGPGEDARLAANVERLRGIGSNIQYVSADQVADMQPHLSAAGIGGAAFEPEGGYAEPRKATLAFRDAAERAGVLFFEGMPVRSLIIRSGRVAGVRLDRGEVSAPNVVMAAGAWSARLLVDLGIDLPVLPIRMTAGLIRHAPFPIAPMTFIDSGEDVYLRPTAEPGLAFVSVRDADHNSLVDPKTFDFAQVVDTGASVAAIERLRTRIPALKACPERQWAAIDGVTADRRGIYGRTELEGLTLAVGGSYKGFKSAPAVGRLVAAIVCNEATEFDTRHFELARFAERAVTRQPASYSLSNVG